MFKCIELDEGEIYLFYDVCEVLHWHDLQCVMLVIIGSSVCGWNTSLYIFNFAFKWKVIMETTEKLSQLKEQPIKKLVVRIPIMNLNITIGRLLK